MKITKNDKVPDEYSERWLAGAAYRFDGEIGKKYEYKFEAWTDEGMRVVNAEWYDNPVTQEYHSMPFKLTTDHQIFSFTGSYAIVVQMYPRKI